MNKLLIALIFTITSAYATAEDSKSKSETGKNDLKNPQVQQQQNRVDMNSKKLNSEKAKKTKSKDKGMHIKDEVTDTTQNEPANAVEIKSSSPSVN